MKHRKDRKEITRLLLLLFVIALTLNACEMGTPIRDAEYPDQLIYLPAAVQGPFMIDDVAKRIGDAPVEGSTFRYVVDNDSREFIVPLGVYRSGINNAGAFSVDIEPNTDTITDLIAAGDTIITLLPSDQFTLDNSVDMPDGEELAKFELVVDLDFLLDNYPTEVYAIGVSISSPDRETSPGLGTAVIVIYTNMLKPEAGFTYSPNDEDPNTISFLNSSTMAVSFDWDFGDGSVSDEENPTHTYASSGTYSVVLTATGVTGAVDESTFTVDVNIP